jgi:DNA-binding NarL/FixJ family response regulator
MRAEGREHPQILFVDDEPRVLDGLRDLLRPRPYRLSFATSGEQALDALRQDVADVIVTDERMPGLPGSTLCAVVASEFPRTQRLLLTGHASVEVAMAAINEGRVTAFLRKPVKAAELEQALEKALKARAVELAQDRFACAASELVRAVGDPVNTSPARFVATPSIAVGGFAAETMRLLSPREREVFDLFVEGFRASQVAKMLFRSHHTVRNHLKGIFRKLDVNSQEELLARARSRPQPTMPSRSGGS